MTVSICRLHQPGDLDQHQEALNDVLSMLDNITIFLKSDELLIDPGAEPQTKDSVGVLEHL